MIHENLGDPIPFDDHATSVSLPQWKDVVDYEEGNPRVVNVMKIGYPRFKIHTSVETLSRALVAKKYDINEYSAFVVPSKDVVLRFKRFMDDGLKLIETTVSSNQITVEAVGYEDFWAIYFPTSVFKLGKAYWQHTGEIISSRQAEDILYALHISIPPLTALHPVLQSRQCYSDHILDSLVSTTTNHSDNTPNNGTSTHTTAEGNSIEKSNKKQSHQRMSRIYEVSDDKKKGLKEKALIEIRSRISSYIQQPGEDKDLEIRIVLTTSGMASIYSALRLVQAFYTQGNTGHSSYQLTQLETVVFGFPYLDTLKIMQRPELNPGGVHFFGHGNEQDLDKLEDILKTYKSSPNSSKRISAVFTECPSNPLIIAPNLVRLTALAKEYDFLLIVDDTISSFCNVDLFHSPGTGVNVDLLCSSLTKIFNGRGDVLAGSLIINTYSRYSTLLQSYIPSLSIPSLYYSDAILLELNSRTYPSRCHQMNQTTHQLVTWLRQQTYCVENIYYSTSTSYSADTSGTAGVQLTQKSNYDTVLRNSTQLSDVLREQHFQPGYGYLFSIVFHPSFDQKVFYDALELHKGPSLGTMFTLVSPYTLLAHYYELDWAATYNVSDRLIRVSVGIESYEDLQYKFKKALLAAKYPKLWQMLLTKVNHTRAATRILEYVYPL